MIKQIYQDKKTVFSLEVFPPKRDDDLTFLYPTLDGLKELHPDFISVTYGAGGSTGKKTAAIASYIQNHCNIEALAHLTCIALTQPLLMELLEELKSDHIYNILALRGDRSADMSVETFNTRAFTYASDMVPLIKASAPFCIAGACYPEKHVEAPTMDEDLKHLCYKVSQGADFLITQLFFDNEMYYRFEEQARNRGISIPISTGIMPITSVNQIGTTISLSGAKIPKKLVTIIDKYKNDPEDMKKAGLDYAANQILELMEHQVDGIHLYTMNKLDISQFIFKNCKTTNLL